MCLFETSIYSALADNVMGMLAAKEELIFLLSGAVTKQMCGAFADSLWRS